MQDYNSQDTTELAKALIKVQRQLQPATKDANNPFTKSRYATLNSVMDSCRDALLSNNIWLCQYPVPAEPGYLGLVTKLTHAESGKWQSSLAVVPLPKAEPQGVGISMTCAGMRFQPCSASSRRKIRTESSLQTTPTAFRDRIAP